MRRKLWLGLALLFIIGVTAGVTAVAVEDYLVKKYGYDLARDADQKRADHLQSVLLVHEGFHLGGVPHTHLMQLVPKKRGHSEFAPKAQSTRGEFEALGHVARPDSGARRRLPTVGEVLFPAGPPRSTLSAGTFRSPA